MKENILKIKYGIPFVNFEYLSDNTVNEIVFAFSNILEKYPLIKKYLVAVGIREDIENEMNRFILQQNKNSNYLKLPTHPKMFQRVMLKDKEGNVLFEGIAYHKDLDRVSYAENIHIAVHTRNIKGQIYHELAHILDDILGISETIYDFLVNNSIMLDRIQKEVSIYATVNPYEFVAEVFAEYHSSEVRSDVVNIVMDYINDLYYNLEEKKKI